MPLPSSKTINSLAWAAANPHASMRASKPSPRHTDMASTRAGVRLAHRAGIGAIVQPGGSIRDQDSIDYCNAHGMSMVFTHHRHFRH